MNIIQFHAEKKLRTRRADCLSALHLDEASHAELTGQLSAVFVFSVLWSMMNTELRDTSEFTFFPLSIEDIPFHYLLPLSSGSHFFYNRRPIVVRLRPAKCEKPFPLRREMFSLPMGFILRSLDDSFFSMLRYVIRPSRRPLKFMLSL